MRDLAGSVKIPFFLGAGVVWVAEGQTVSSQNGTTGIRHSKGCPFLFAFAGKKLIHEGYALPTMCRFL